MLHPQCSTDVTSNRRTDRSRPHSHARSQLRRPTGHERADVTFVHIDVRGLVEGDPNNGLHTPVLLSAEFYTSDSSVISRVRSARAGVVEWVPKR